MKEIADRINESRRTLIRNGITIAAVGVVATAGLLKATPAHAQAGEIRGWGNHKGAVGELTNVKRPCVHWSTSRGSSKNSRP